MNRRASISRCVMITGGAGFIGSNLVRHVLNHTTHTVVNVDKLTYAGNLDSLRDVARNPRHIFIRTDICDSVHLHRILDTHSPDAVIHLAAESHVDRSIDDPGEFIQTNVNGTFTLLQAARAHWQKLRRGKRERFRFIHVSTDEVFGSLKPRGRRFSESSPYDPHSPYSASKAASDHLVRSWHHTYGFPAIVTNCSNNYGPYQFPEKLIPLAVLKALRGAPIPIYGQGENVRDWLHVDDHAEALLRVLEKGRPGETYLIGGNNERRNIDVVKALCEILDDLNPNPKVRRHEELIKFVPDRPGHDFRYAIDSSKIRRELGWKPRHGGAAGLRSTVQWYLDHREWWTRILDGSYSLARLGLRKATPS